MSTARFITIRTLSSSIEAEMMRDLLEQEGIAATIQGSGHSALLGGLASAALQVPLQVSERDAKRAKRILAALDDFDSADSPDELHAADPSDIHSAEGPYRSSRLEVPAPVRSKRKAIGIAIILPCVFGIFGAGHFYVRSYLTGFILLVLAWSGIALTIATGMRWPLLAPPLVILYDAIRSAGLASRSTE